MAPRGPPPEAEPSHGGWSEQGELSAPNASRSGPRYVIGALVGRGGMGEVHAAMDTHLGRDVAIKQVAIDRADDPLAQARLAREAAVTSRLDHPGIVSVYDVGALPDGRPFYTMRLVRGRTLAEVAASAADRPHLIRHILAAAEAVAAANEAGLVHRDLKPANILVGAHGETQVVDWGLATPTPGAVARWANLPAPDPHGRVGTDRYMSPEQARGEPADPRDDVWSLGVTLGELVDDPPPELAAIGARARAVEGRYPDCAALAADLLRWFEGRRVNAYSYRPTDLLVRALRAYRLPLAVGLAAIVSLVVTVAAGWHQTSLSLERALAAEADASTRLADLELQHAVEATRSGAREMAERLALAVLRRREDPLARGVFAAFGLADRPRRPREEAGPTCTWSALPPGAGWVLCGRRGTVSRWEAGHDVWTAALPAAAGAAYEDRAVAWGAEGNSWSLEADDGTILGAWPRPTEEWVLSRSPRSIWAGSAPQDAGTSGCTRRLQTSAVRDGTLAAICNDGTVLFGEPAALRRLPTEASGDQVATAIALSPDHHIIIGTVRGRILVASPETGATLLVGESGLGIVTALAVSLDGRHVAIDAERGVGLLRLDTGALVTGFESGHPRALGFSAAGLVIHDGAVRTWSIPQGVPAMTRTAAGLTDVAVAPTGDRIAVVGGGGTVTEIDLRGGPVTTHSFGAEVVKSASYGPDGLIVTGMDRPLLARLGGEAFPSARPLRRVVALAGAVVGIDLDRGLYRWTGSSPELLEPTRQFVDLERDGESLVVLDAEGAVVRLEGSQLTPLAQYAGARAVASNHGTLVVATPRGVTLAGNGQDRELDTGGATALDVAIDTHHVAAGTLDGRIFVWSRAGALMGVLPGHTERVTAVEFLPDGDLVSVSWDKTARIWSLAALDRPIAALTMEVTAAWD